MIRSYISLGEHRGFMRGKKEYEVYNKKVEPSDYEGLLKNQEFLNILIGIRQVNRKLLNYRNVLQTRTKEIQAVIENELENRINNEPPTKNRIIIQTDLVVTINR